MSPNVQKRQVFPITPIVRINCHAVVAWPSLQA